MGKINTLADLKRLKVGDKIRLISCLSNPNPNDAADANPLSLDRWIEVAHKARGLTREINLMQTNSLRFSPTAESQGKGSWLYFPKAALFKATARGFAILPASKWDYYLEYEKKKKKKED